ncbi:unnamed protein product [Rotaria sordida]|uniref:Uncharacterized protein n=1 Tax=Rotaria sordida TaxID=392033 RepID=A0A815US57_9BILA|nr:unnamed protein product [Rotaria sordida]CAF4051229.1 unnamed protein product [Rotaria sordida]
MNRDIVTTEHPQSSAHSAHQQPMMFAIRIVFLVSRLKFVEARDQDPFPARLRTATRVIPATIVAQPVIDLVTVHQGYAISTGNWWRFWLTLSPKAEDNDFNFNKEVFRVYRTAQPNTVPIYAFHSETNGLKHNILQQSPNNDESGPNFTNDGIMCYAFSGPHDAPGLIPIYRFWADASYNNDIPGRRYLFSPQKEPEEGAGWEFDKVAFYAFPPAE